MNNKYEVIEFIVSSDIDSAVNMLLDYKNKGILVCGDFNGTTLYSDTVTLDSAYLDILGKTKTEYLTEYLAERQQWKENYDKQEKEFKEQIPFLIKQWRKKGREVLTEDKWKYWYKIVPIRLNDLYHGMELECCLDIIKILNNNGSLEQAKTMINNQNHSGMSFALVCAMVKEFCDRGSEFVDFVK
jgi:hypothetical protein